MHASVVVWELLVICAMGVGALVSALILAALWSTPEAHAPPRLVHHRVRNLAGAFAALALSTMMGAMIFVVVPLLFVMTPFFVFGAWTLFEPPKMVVYR